MPFAQDFAICIFLHKISRQLAVFAGRNCSTLISVLRHCTQFWTVGVKQGIVLQLFLQSLIPSQRCCTFSLHISQCIGLFCTHLIIQRISGLWHLPAIHTGILLGNAGQRSGSLYSSGTLLRCCAFCSSTATAIEKPLQRICCTAYAGCSKNCTSNIFGDLAGTAWSLPRLVTLIKAQICKATRFCTKPSSGSKRTGYGGSFGSNIAGNSRYRTTSSHHSHNISKETSGRTRYRCADIIHDAIQLLGSFHISISDNGPCHKPVDRP